jgi:hypothetical protein
MTSASLLTMALVLTLQNPSVQTLRGRAGAAVGSEWRVVWVAADDGASAPETHCQAVSSADWRCDLAEGARGVVAVVGAQDVAGFVIGPQDGGAPTRTVGQWARLLRLIPTSVSLDDCRLAQAAAWTIQKSPVRQRSRRFVQVPNSGVQVVGISPTAFWISGTQSDRDGFIEVQGPGIATIRIRSEALQAGPPDEPFLAYVGLPMSITGRVRTSDGHSAEAVDVELLETLAADSAESDRGDSSEFISRARTRTDESGSFLFDGLDQGRYEIVASHVTQGRGVASLKSMSDPVVITLVQPARATGRVLQHGLPAIGARVRFVPEPAAWMSSTDATALISPEVGTDTTGAFELWLPPEHVGELQVIGRNGALTRVRLPSTAPNGDFHLGDVLLPDPHHLVVRLLANAPCELYATGPLGSLGLTTVHAERGSNAYWFDVPEPGSWAFSAECGPIALEIDPPAVTVPSEGPDVTIDVYLVESAGDS